MILFVGCGTGEEALCLQSIYPEADVVGIDIRLPAMRGVAGKIDFVLASALNLPFRGYALDFCYCYHVLEHVTDPVACVSEMARTLKTEGQLYLSTPNIKRLLLYVLSAQEEKMSTIISRNAHEWIARLMHRFSHERGYHTGFTHADLSSILATSFSEVRFITDAYIFYITKGSTWQPFARFLSWIHALGIVAPSHAVYCRRPRRSTVKIP
jgi:ubiquinone/menaquinone biosynthesis C-methylase UbiE